MLGGFIACPPVGRALFCWGLLPFPALCLETRAAGPQGDADVPAALGARVQQAAAANGPFPLLQERGCWPKALC